MPNNENSFAHYGVEFVAVDGGGCDGCAFYSIECGCAAYEAKCMKRSRKDGREVIFKKKVTLEME